ncbi:LysR family transcriptional regulator [Trinickia mobilis]|uniref:LysR family transcriptional regulator n=1 Tax=Trinickia mobilis TaxID=2816356 RepID=UPI001A8C3D4F|nr:LysR family transcriptional regulator [Trinickia mobilis]
MSAPSSGAIERFFRSGLKLPHLRILVSLAELGQVTRVAAAFHVTQPAISKQIAEIEESLGVQIVQRIGNAVELTGIGRVIVDHGRAVLRQLELARRDVSALAAGTGGHVRVGAVVTIPEPIIANAVRLFMRRAPAASFSFIEATLDRLIRQLDDGELDIALGRNHLPGVQMRLRQETLHREPFVFVVGAGHPLANPERVVCWEDLRQCRWIVPLRGAPAFATLAETLSAHDIVLAGADVESSSLALNIALIKTGDFVSILPLSVARSHMVRGTMRVLPLPPLEPLGEVVVYWRTDSTAPATSLFNECLREASAEPYDEPFPGAG